VHDYTTARDQLMGGRLSIILSAGKRPPLMSKCDGE